MSIQIETTLITVIVALIVGILTVVGSYVIGSKQLKQNEEKTRKELELELNKFREEQKKWIPNLQTAYELEKYKLRLASYPEVFVIIGKLSHKAREPVKAENAKQIADELNDWFYSTGGMCADTSTRGAIMKLRGACLTWDKQGGSKPPPDLYKWRNYALLLLRNDIGIKGLESFDYESSLSLIVKVQKEINNAMKEENAS